MGKSDANPLDGGLFSVGVVDHRSGGTAASAVRRWPVAYGSAGLWGVVADAACRGRTAAHSQGKAGSWGIGAGCLPNGDPSQCRRPHSWGAGACWRQPCM